MTPEEKRKFDELYEMVHESNLMIKKIRGTQKTAQMFKALYWVLILGASVAAYYSVQPYIMQVKDVYSGGQSTLESIKNLGSEIEEFQNW